jgi:lipopolysaccharide/colanic/teichoic acid biosynthesis glycosyltransferase
MIKRIFDFIFAFTGLIVLLPAMVLISILIKIKMPGPIFFKQKRVGQFGELFVMIKFRTMKVDHGGSSVSVKGESRITPLGATLRKYKLDELPELWNVLKGEMSFVGPRPDVPGYADQLLGEDRNILLLKPGITGPASMKYSNEEEILAFQSDPKMYNDTVIYPDKVRINLEYLKRRTIVMDLWLIILTIVGKKPNYSWI